MRAFTAANSPARVYAHTSVYASGNFWEFLWRTSGLQFIAFLVVGYAFYGSQPKVGASTADLSAFYAGDRTRILVAAVCFGFAVLNLLWFAAAIRTTLADAGRDGWGAAETAASAAVGAVFVLLTALVAGVAYAIARSGDTTLVSALNDLVWAVVVLAAFPRAMLIMAGTFGLWRAGIISNGLFAAGVVALVLVLLGGTTWLNSGFWAPDGAYSRFISPAITVVWVLVVSRILLTRGPAREGW